MMPPMPRCLRSFRMLYYHFFVMCYFSAVGNGLGTVDVDASSSLINHQISKPLKIGSNQYVISFPASEQGARKMAHNFCTEKGPSFGIREANFESDCLGPISTFLMDVLQKEKEKISKKSTHVDDTIINMSIEIAGVTYSLSMNPAEESTTAVAEKFCQKNMNTFGLTEASMTNCITPIHSAVLEAIEKEKYERMESFTDQAEKHQTQEITNPTKTELPGRLIIPVEIAGTSFNIEYSSLDAITSVSKKFCIKNIGKLGIRFGDIKQSCIAPIEAQISQVLEKYKQTAIDAQRTKNLGNRSGKDEQLKASTKNDDNQFIPVSSLKVTLKIKEKKYLINVDPSATNGATVSAEQFCNHRRDQLGIALEEIDDCIVPVTDYIQKAVDQHNNAKSQAIVRAIATSQRAVILLDKTA